MPTRDHAATARLCRQQAAITTNKATAQLLRKMAEQYEKLAEKARG